MHAYFKASWLPHSSELVSNRVLQALRQMPWHAVPSFCLFQNCSGRQILVRGRLTPLLSCLVPAG